MNFNTWLIDDDENFLSFMRIWFRNNFNCELRTYTNSEQLYKDLKSLPRPNLILIDIRLDDQNGLRISNDLHRMYPSIRFIHLSSLEGESIFEDDYTIIGKPIDSNILANEIEKKLAA